MMHAKRALVAGVGIGLLGVAAACSAVDGSQRDDTGPATDETDSGAAYPGSAAESLPSSGVVVVHAAGFPAFRLCFENRPTDVPQPDHQLMPESNLVGVETGSFVRLPPMVAPGKIYVIDERTIRGRTSTCADLIGVEGGAPALLHEGNDYNVVYDPITTPVGVGQAQVLALTGCASEVTLRSLKLDPARCPADFDASTGNMSAHVVSLPATAPVPGTLAVRVYQLSTSLDAVSEVGVSFGTLDQVAQPLATPLSVERLFETASEHFLEVPDAGEQVYATSGFRIQTTTRAPANGSGAVSFFDQSLATVQDLSSSNDVPASYFAAASSYALFLIGDPTIPADAGAESARLGLHILAVPVADPDAPDGGVDAGADAAASADAGQ